MYLLLIVPIIDFIGFSTNFTILSKRSNKYNIQGGTHSFIRKTVLTFWE